VFDVEKMEESENSSGGLGHGVVIESERHGRGGKVGFY